jgi:hypothetical protein
MSPRDKRCIEQRAAVTWMGHIPQFVGGFDPNPSRLSHWEESMDRAPVVWLKERIICLGAPHSGQLLRAGGLIA